MAKAAEVTFISNYSNHRLTRRAWVEKPLGDNSGGWVTSQVPVRYQFEAGMEDGKVVGVLTVKAGQDKLVDHGGWLAAGQEQGVERDAVAALRAHREYGHDFVQQATPAKLVRARIRSAIANLNGEDLEALISEERAEHNRRELVTEAQDALELVREQMANIRAAQEQAALEEQEKAVKAKPKAKAAAAA